MSLAAEQLLNAFRDTSRAHIESQPGSFIGVVLQQPADAGSGESLPTWHTFTFPTEGELVAWYGDWVGTPALYAYLAAINRATGDDPILEAGAGTERRAMAADAPIEPRPVANMKGPRTMEHGPFDRMRELIAEHETYWTDIAQHNQRSSLMKWWLSERWNPFFATWSDLVLRHGLSNVDVDVIAEQLGALNALRKEAHQRQIPLPPSGDPIVITRGGRGGGGGGGGGGIGGRGGGASAVVRRGRSSGGVIDDGFDTDVSIVDADPDDAPQNERRIDLTARVAGPHHGGGGHHGGHHGGSHRRGRRWSGGGGWGGGWDGWGWDGYYYGPYWIDEIEVDDEDEGEPDEDVVSGAPAGSAVTMGRWGGGEVRRGSELQRGPRTMPHAGGHGPGGYYRPGARYPGRWWRGARGPEWVESDVNLLIPDDQDAEYDLPPPSTGEVPIVEPISGDGTSVVPGAEPGTVIRQDAAQTVAQGAPMYRYGNDNSLIRCGAVLAPITDAFKVSFDIDSAGMLKAKLCVGDKCYEGQADISNLIRDAIGGARQLHEYLHDTRTVALMRGAYARVGSEVDPLIREMNRITDERFWKQTGYKPGQRLDRHDTEDAEMIPTWISIRYQVAEDFGRELAQVGERRERVAARGDLAARPLMRGDLRVQALMRGEMIIGAGCGSRTYNGVSQQMLGTILQRLRDRGADVTGANPWNVVTHDHGVELRGTWDANTNQLTLEVTDSDFIAPCSAIWKELNGWLNEIGAAEVASAAQLVRATSNLLVGKLLNQHRNEVMSGWWHSLTHSVSNAVSSAAHGIASAGKSLASGVGKTLVTLKGPITIAAAAAATSLVGPEAGPIAAQLTGSLIDATAGSGSAQQVAQQAVQAATQAAQADPQIASALAAAHQAVAQTTAAAHIAQTVQQAAQGNSAAQKQVEELAQAAAQGDPAAQAAAQAAQQLTDAAAQVSNDAAAVSGSRGDRGLLPSDRSMLARAAADIARGRVVGVVIPKDNPLQVHIFNTPDEADEWFGSWMSIPHAIDYIAYYDKSDSTYPGPLNEMRGATDRVSGDIGDLLSEVRKAALEAVSRWTLDERTSKFVVYVMYGSSDAGSRGYTTGFPTAEAKHSYIQQVLPLLRRGDAAHGDPVYLAEFDAQFWPPNFVGEDYNFANAVASDDVPTKASGFSQLPFKRVTHTQSSPWNATAMYGER